MRVKRRAAALAVALGTVAGLAPVVAIAPAAADCNAPIIMFSRTGVFLPAEVAAATGRQAVGNTTYHSGTVGCTMGEQGFTADTFYAYPGATMASARMLSTSGAVSGCLHGNLIEGGNACAEWPLTEHTIPGNFYADSPWVPMDPTVTSGTKQASAAGQFSAVYRTIDQ